jgi:hypothetical protein
MSQVAMRIFLTFLPYIFRFIVAEFPQADLPCRGYHVADVTPEGMVMVIVNHNVTYSNLYISDIVSEHEVRSWSLSTTV